MSIRLEIFDGSTPLLEKMQLLSHGMALECLSVAGSILQKEARKAMRRERHKWHQVFKDGKIVVKQSTLRELGLRISHKDGSLSNPESMSSMITSYLMERAMTVVIGGRHKAFTPNRRRDGIITGKMGRQKGVSGATQAILHKLNFGGYLDKQLPDYERAKNQIGAKYTKYVGYKFMQKGFNNAKYAIEEAMTKRYTSLLNKAVNRVDIKLKKRVS